MSKLHIPFNETDATVMVNIDEYAYLMQCHALLQTILNYTGYDVSTAVETAKRVLAETEETAADV